MHDFRSFFEQTWPRPEKRLPESDGPFFVCGNNSKTVESVLNSDYGIGMDVDGYFVGSHGQKIGVVSGPDQLPDDGTGGTLFLVIPDMHFSDRICRVIEAAKLRNMAVVEI